MARSGAPMTTGRNPGRYSECPSPSQSKSQELGPELSLCVSQMESLEAADRNSVPLMSLTMLGEQLNLVVSSSQNKVSDNSTKCSEKANH